MQQSGAMPDYEGFLCACLRGEDPGWPFGQDEVKTEYVFGRACYHGVLPLLHDRFDRGILSSEGWPSDVFLGCRASALSQAMWELRHRALLTEVFESLAAKSITPIVFKGAALAYTLYPQGELRSRGDTDFIIPPGTQETVSDAIISIGFERVAGMSGESISYQANFIRGEPGGVWHTLDVHWRINNSELLSRLFTHEELLAQSQPIPELGTSARAAGPVHALLIACMHRATHKHNPYYVNGIAYFSGDRLIWLYDIHLLADSFTARQWSEFIHQAKQKGLTAVCLEGLERANMAYQTAIPESVKAELAHSDSSKRLEPYFSGSPLRQQWMDFCAISGFSRKLRFISQTLFPPASYMRDKYPQGGWLPWLYFRRTASGILKRLKPGP